MKLAKDDLIAALRVRYDYYSAQTMFELARTRAGLDEQHTYDVAEIRAFRAALTSVGDRIDGVQARLELLLGASPDAEPVQAKPEPVPPPPAKPAVEAPAPAKPPADAQPAAKPTKAAAAAKPSEPQRRKEPQAIETTVVLTAVELADGEQVMMCGGDPELGDWDPEHAHPMTRDGGRWLAKVKIAPEIEVGFKFLRRAADGSVVWEDGADRALVAGSPLEAIWR